MATAHAEEVEEAPKGLLAAVEKIGNKVPHPVLMFGYLIVLVIVLSWGLALAGVSITEQIAVPVSTGTEYDYYEDTTQPGVTVPQDPYDEDWTIVEEVIPIKSLLSVEGIRFIFSSFVNNFAGFGVVAVTFIAMMGAGVAEESGLLGSLIRKLVGAAPTWALTFILILVGVVSSVASDAGYLILIPLSAAAFASVGRHPLAGLAAGFAGVAAIFMVNISLTPTDAMITEIANESLALAGGEPITIVANYYFMVASSFIMALVAAVITERIVEPRLGPWTPEAGAVVHTDAAELPAEADKRGSRFALIGFGIVLTIVALATFLPGAPLRDPETGDIIGNTPFMDSLLFIIMLAFLVSGAAYGVGAGTMKGSGDIIKAITKTFSGLGGMVLMLLMISQFIAFFNWTNLPQVIAGSLAGVLEQANIGAIPLLIGFIVVIVLLDFIMPGSLPKWAIFAPIFVPLFMRLGVAPQTLLAAYRVADSPVNALTPLMVYLPFIVTIAQRYQKKAGIGTVVALMLPYSITLLVVWTVLFLGWFALDIPLGPGYPPSVP